MPGVPASPAACGPLPARVWKLTPEQLARTASAALGLDAAGIVAGLRGTLTRTGLFSNDASVSDLSQPHVEELGAAAAGLARQALTRPERLAPCLATKPFTATCVRDAIAGVGERLYRRPVAPDELTALVGFYDAQSAASGPEVGLRQVLRVMLMSWNTLFRTELGDASATGATVKLTPFERAQALSFFLTDAPPDAELYAAAKAGRLDSKADIETHARRLIDTAAKGQGLRAFFTEHLGLEKVPGITKDAKRYPAFGPQLARDMVVETQAFVDHVLWKGDARLSTLLTSKIGFVNARLATLYGVPGVTGEELKQVTLPSTRAGVITQASFLAVNASAVDADPVRRGRLYRETFLCQHVPDPPPDIPAIPPASSTTQTTRERFAQHSLDPRCQGCHAKMDPIGFALQTFDGIGTARTTEAGKPIDTRGVLVDTKSGDQPFTDAADLARVTAATPDAAACVVERLYAWGRGRVPAAADACGVEALAHRFAASGGDVRALAVDIVTADDFFVRAR